MDQSAFERLLAETQAAQPSTPAPSPQQATPQPQEAAPGMEDLEVDPEAATSFMDAIVQGFQMGAGAPGQAGIPTLSQEIVTGPNATDADKLDVVTAAGAPAITGGLKSAFETKDFLFGQTAPEDQSMFRQKVEGLDAAMKEDHPVVAGLASGIGQFTVAMVGLGKIAQAGKVIPWVGNAASTIQNARGGAAALETGKAALAGAIAFDPHEERLSNLIQSTPLANPVSAWLAAKPEDSAAWGRVKNALESIGMDAAIIGTLKAGGTIWKHLKAGDTGAAQTAAEAFQKERAAGGNQDPAQPAPVAQPPQPVPENSPSPLPEMQDPNAMPEANPVPTPEAEPVAQPEAVAPQAGVFRPLVSVGDDFVPTLLDDIPKSLENAEKDWEAIAANGGWQRTLERDEPLSPDLSALYDRINTTGDFGQMIDLAVNHKLEDLKAKGFRDVVSDEKLTQQVSRFAELVGDDPATVLGQLQEAGEAAGERTARMLTLGSLSAKAFQDASTMAERYRWGDFSKYGSAEAMQAEINKRFDIALTTLKMADEVRSEAGRTLRALRGRPFDPALFETLRSDPLARDRFYELLSESGGDPKKLRILAEPGLAGKLMDTAIYIRINGLLSGYTTQVVNMLGNGYMLGVRPLERILGAVPLTAAGGKAGAEARGIIKENLRQYTYMGTALMDGFRIAGKAFLENDGVLKRHASDAVEATSGQRWQVPGSQGLNRNYFKPINNVADLIHNAVSVPLTAIGLPTRTLGGIDELVKQTVYRSKVMARAHIDATEKAIASGLSGKAAQQFVSTHVRKVLEDAFDAEGRGLDTAALREADIATFQQDLAPRTLGRQVQSAVANDDTRMLRLILPFVKTPTNVIRYAIKMTPGLNLLQTEYRQMISGKFGKEAQAQAIGQASMGALFMGSAAFLSSQGMITGGGPSDPKLKATLNATGWRPYSFVRRNEDGTTTYVPFNRMDPVGLPLGIIADIQDAMHVLGDEAETSAEAEAAVSALFVSLSKQFTSRTYLLSLNQALEAITDPDRNLERFGGDMVASFVPFSSATRQLSEDPYLRDARSVADKLLKAVPGMSPDLPPRYDWLGMPIVNRQGLWTDDNGTLVDKEVQRLALLQGGSALNPPGPNMANQVDLREITLTTGENAYVALQRLSGQPAPNATPLRTRVANLMRTEAYKRAPDGDRDTKGTKLWLLGKVVNKYRDVAAKRVRADKNVREALMKAQRKVIDHYKHLREAPAQGQQQGSLGAVLKGFGADR